MHNLTEALSLASLGIPFFPLKANKRPCVEGGFKAASADPDAIARMFADPAAALIGVPTGPASGFDVLDIDPKSGGDEWLKENESRLPATRRHATRSGGAHYLFKHTPGMRNSAGRIAPGVDIRGDGGYIVWWPAYGFPASGAEWAPLPDWLLIQALRPINPNTPAPDAEELAAPDVESLLSMLADMPNPAETSRDEYTAVNLAVQGAIRGLEALGKLEDPSAVWDAAAEWSARWDHANASDFETERQRWVDDWSTRDRDISGWRHLIGMAAKLGADVSRFTLAAAASEFGDLPPEPEPVAPAKTAAPATASARKPSGVPTEPSVNEETEDAVARGFATDMGSVVAYDHSSCSWYLFDLKGGAWRRDDAGRGFAVVREYVGQVRALFGGSDKTMASASFFSSVERLARSDPRLATTSAVWDTNPWLLGVPGGMVDLRTGAVLPPDPALRIAKQTLVAPAAPGTPAPLWLSFLGSATGQDSDLQAFLQRLVGYCLTGDVSEEVVAFAYGEGGTGKGTFFGTLMAILAAYGVQMPADVFAAKSNTNGEYARARMAGSRLVMASETARGAAWGESSLKELSGNEGLIPAREPYGKPFEYRGQFKIIITGNHAPNLRGASSAMERRLRVIPFRHKPPRRDETLKERLVAEYPAILRWIIDGCLMWQRDRLGTCAAVAEASRAYFEEQDAISAWAAERLQLGDGFATKRADLLSDFSAWARSNGEPPMSASEFYEGICRALPVVAVKREGTRYLRGATLRTAETESEFPAVTESDLARLIH